MTVYKKIRFKKEKKNGKKRELNITLELLNLI